MTEPINLNHDLVQLLLPMLLADKTTRKNIVFATDSYADQGERFAPTHEITTDLLSFMDLKPRILKSLEEQTLRTRKKAEVFTPAWLCCKMNNHCDEEWFGRSDMFNHLEGETWTVTKEPVVFPQKKTWKHYIDSRRLEITCGEAPYVISRYDAATGEPIALENRIGILDRKMRIVNENTTEYVEWEKWTIRAFQSVYGYEWQGDSLLIARINNIREFHYSRNPKIVEFLTEYDFVKELGEGVDRVFREMKEAKLPEPVYKQSDFMLYAMLRNKNWNREGITELTLHENENDKSQVKYRTGHDEGLTGHDNDQEERRTGHDNDQEECRTGHDEGLTGHDNGQKEHQTGHDEIAEIQRKLLSFCETPRTRTEMMDYFGLTARSNFYDLYMKPLVESGQLMMTIPDKPKSKNQKYIAKKENNDHGLF